MVQVHAWVEFSANSLVDSVHLENRLCECVNVLLKK